MSVNTAQIGLTGSDQEALFLKVYTGSFVTAPKSSTFLYDGVASNFVFKPPTPAFGKEFQFLTMAEVPTPQEFDPGDDLLGQAMAVQEGSLFTDKYVMCHHWIGKDKMDQAHYANQILPQLARAHKSQIERQYDKRAMITAAKGARQVTAVTKEGLLVHNGANRVTRSGGSIAAAYPLSSTGAANLRADLRTLGLALSQDNIAPGHQNRAIILDPYLKMVLTFDNTGQVFSKDYIYTFNGNDQQKHEVNVIEGFTLLAEANTTSNNGPLPNQLITDGPVKYQGNFTAQAADGIPGVLVFSRSMANEYGIGCVEFEPIQNVVMYFREKLAWLIMTYSRSGCDIMHPWCLGSVEAIT